MTAIKHLSSSRAVRYTLSLALSASILMSTDWSRAQRATTRPVAPAVPPVVAPPAGEADQWDKIDERLVFLTQQLSSVQTSLLAVDAALKKAGYQKSTQQAAVERYDKGGELMDRNGGAPVRWDEF